VNCSRIKPIDRFNDKEPSLFARESIKSINKQISSSLLKIKHHSIRLSSSIVEHRHPFDPLSKQTSSCLVIRSLKSVSKNSEIVSLKPLMLIHRNHERNHQVLHHSFMKMMNHSLKR